MSFIFQAILDRYNLPSELERGKKVAWVASKHRDRMKKGEIVYSRASTQYIGVPNLFGLIFGRTSSALHSFRPDTI